MPKSTHMKLITRKEFRNLAGIHQPFCASIFIPTHRSGMEVFEKEDVTALRNQLKEVKAEMESRGCPPRDLTRILEPAEALISERDFWGNQSDGLALFLADGFFQQFSVPVQFEPFNYVSGEFYLKPLLPLFYGDGRFYLLTLSLKETKLYECSRYSITPLSIEDLIPANMEEVVGADYEQNYLQFRSQPGGTSVFHGHGAGKDDRKDEIQRYFRAIDKGLREILRDLNAPLVMASVDYLHSMYREISTYAHIFPEYIRTNPDNADPLMLHKKAWIIVQPTFDQERRDKMALFEQFQGTGRTSSSLEEIIPTALDGRLDALFIENRSDVWGIYDPAGHKTTICDTRLPGSVSLLNLIATKALLKGAKVYLNEPEDMPGGDGGKVKGLFYY